MPYIAVRGAIVECNQGIAPSTLDTSRELPVIQSKPVQTVEDKTLLPNTFGTCNLQPLPGGGFNLCQPSVNTRWAAPAKDYTVGVSKKIPALTDTSFTFCTMGGLITITDAFQTKEENNAELTLKNIIDLWATVYDKVNPDKREDLLNDLVCAASKDGIAYKDVNIDDLKKRDAQAYSEDMKTCPEEDGLKCDTDKKASDNTEVVNVQSNEQKNIEIAKRNSKYKGVGREGWKPDIIVCHITDGYDSRDWLCCTERVAKSEGEKPPQPASSHFLVARDGRITQLVDLKDTAWCNVTSNDPKSIRANKLSLLEAVVKRKANANLYTVSIEHEGRYRVTRGALTEAQLDATVELIKYIRREVMRLFDIDIKIDKDHIVRHSCITPKWKPDCPGEKFPYDEIFKRLESNPVEPKVKINEVKGHQH